MAVQHALRIARRARRVAQRAGGALVELGPLELRRFRRDQRLVTARLRQRGRRHVRVVGEDHAAFELRQPRLQLLDQRHERRIEEQPAILGVIDDVGDLLFEQPRIDGVADEARAGHAVVDLEVPEVVPGQRGDAIALLHAEPLQRVRELARAGECLAVRVAVRGLIRGDRNDLAIADAAVLRAAGSR